MKNQVLEVVKKIIIDGVKIEQAHRFTILEVCDTMIVAREEDNNSLQLKFPRRCWGNFKMIEPEVYFFCL